MRPSLKLLLLSTCLVLTTTASAEERLPGDSGVQHDLRCMSIVMGAAFNEEIVFANSDKFFSTGVAGLGYWLRKILAAEPDIDLGKRLRSEMLWIESLQNENEAAKQKLISEAEECASEWLPVMERFNAAFPHEGGPEQDDQ